MRRVIVVAVLLLGGCKGQDAGESPGGEASAAIPATSAPAPPPPKPAREEVLTGELKDLLKAYGENEVRGDALVKGKIIQVTGTVGEVKKDLTDAIFVTVGTGAMLEVPVVQCFIATGEEQAAAALSKGQKVTVRGRVEGLMMNVIVRDCAINPTMKLCKKLQAQLGAKRCSVDEKTGDAGGIIIDEQGKATLGGMLTCEGRTGGKSAVELYDLKTAHFAKDAGRTVLGSRDAACFGVFFATDATGIKVAFPDATKTKVQAFFDDL